MTESILAPLVAAEARGFRWRLGPSACQDVVTLYVGHVWHDSKARALHVIPATGATLEACVAAMVAAIAKEEAPA